MSRRTNNLAHAISLRSVGIVLEGLWHGVAVLVQGVDTQTVAVSVRRLNEGWPEGLAAWLTGSCR